MTGGAERDALAGNRDIGFAVEEGLNKLGHIQHRVRRNWGACARIDFHERTAF